MKWHEVKRPSVKGGPMLHDIIWNTKKLTRTDRSQEVYRYPLGSKAQREWH